MQLTSGRSGGTVRFTINIHGTHATNAFAAVILGMQWDRCPHESAARSTHQTFQEKTFLKKYRSPDTFQNFLFIVFIFLAPHFQREAHCVMFHSFL